MRHGEVRFLSCMYVLSLTLLAAFAIHGLTQAVTVSAQLDGRDLVILDAGHGGPDGGCVSPEGTQESDINLAVARKIDAVLGLMGRPSLLLRDSEADLSSPEARSISEKKVSDIQKRVELVAAHPDAILVSIHQNTYPDAACHGAQVFYAKTQGSQALGEQLQKDLASALDPENTRAAKAIAPDIYLMNHVSVPAVLVECGFLTNPPEEEKLKTTEYQTQLAIVIAGSVCRYLSEDSSGV